MGEHVSRVLQLKQNSVTSTLVINKSALQIFDSIVDVYQKIADFVFLQCRLLKYG